MSLGGEPPGEGSEQGTASNLPISILAAESAAEVPTSRTYSSGFAPVLIVEAVLASC